MSDEIRSKAKELLERLDKDAVEIITNKSEENRKDLIYNFYLKYPELNETVKQNFELFASSVGIRIDFFLQKFMKNSSENVKFVEDNIDLLITRKNLDKLIWVVRTLNDVNSSMKEKLNRSLEKNIELYAEAYLTALIFVPRNLYRDEDVEGASKTLAYLFKEVCESESVNLSDIYVKGDGAYSVTLIVGNKVIKIGEKRREYYIPNHRRILQPIVRTNYTSHNAVLVCFEVSDRVRVLTEDECQENPSLLYAVYKDLRKDGIVWTDAKWDNIGILLRDNDTTIDGKHFEVDPCSVGFDKATGVEPLKKGDAVVIDTDYIYRLGSPNIQWFESSKILEKRYDDELISARKKSNETPDDDER